MDSSQTFESACGENKGNLDSAVESKSKMEKQTKSDNEVETLTGRWDGVKKVADDRVKKVRVINPIDVVDVETYCIHGLLWFVDGK